MDKIPLHIVLLDKDLRVNDHAGFASLPSDQAVLAVYLLPSHNDLIHISAIQRQALAISLRDLAMSLEELNIAFVIENQPFMTVLNNLNNDYTLTSLSMYASPQWNSSFLKIIQSNFPALRVTMFDHPTLIDKQDLPFPIHQLPKTFTAFRIAVERPTHVRKPLDKPKQRSIKLNIPSHLERIDLLKTQGLNLVQPMGETAASKHLNDYFFVHRLASTYKQTRNGMARFQDSTRFSPYLAWGNVSARTINEHLKNYEHQFGSNDSTYWIGFELLWRDYFYFLLHNHSINLVLPSEWNHPFMGKWIEGTTGYPLVDASMRELKQTGWMSNRGRQNVASFLVHGLKLPWSWGEAYFQTTLLDYDRTSNLGNWQYLAGVGADPRENRVFNVTLQFKKYDSQGDYVKRWLPELKNIPVPLLYQPWTMNSLQQSLYQCEIGKDYPSRIIDDSRFFFA